LPAAPDTVAAHLAAEGRSRGALDRRLAVLGHAHRAAGHAWTAKHPAIRTVLRGVPRRRRHHRAKRLGPAALERLAAACGGDLAGQRDRALLLLHLAAGLRRGEVVGLDAEHVRFIPAGLHLILVPPPDEGEGGGQPPPPVERVVAPGDADPANCPVRALRAWLEASACRHGPVFRKVDRWGGLGHERLGVDEVRRVLVRRAARAKLGLHKAQRLRARDTSGAERAGEGRVSGQRAAEPPRER
jgi:hypothetical protein